MTVESFLNGLLLTVPQLGETLTAHRDANYGTILPHVFMGDVTRLALAAATGQPRHDVLAKLLGQIETGLLEGSEEVKELILASFVENLTGGTSRLRVLREHMGPTLRAVLDDLLGQN